MHYIIKLLFESVFFHYELIKSTISLLIKDISTEKYFNHLQ